MRPRHCQGSVIKTRYGHKTTTVTRTTVLQLVSTKQRVNGPNDLLSARNPSVSAQNKHLTIPDRDTVKTQSSAIRHDKTRKLEKEPRQDMQLSRLSQNRVRCVSLFGLILYSTVKL